MLDLSTAVLCDFAQVRDRLLFVSSGAVSRLYRQELPSPLGLMVGLVIEVPLEDAGLDHRLRAEVINRHGTVLATLENLFRVSDAGLFPHEVQQVPLVLSITGVRARTWGTHQVRLYLDEELVRALTLYVVPAAGPQAAVRATPTQSRVADDEGSLGGTGTDGLDDLADEPPVDEPPGDSPSIEEAPVPAALPGDPSELTIPIEAEGEDAPWPGDATGAPTELPAPEAPPAPEPVSWGVPSDPEPDPDDAPEPIAAPDPEPAPDPDPEPAPAPDPEPEVAPEPVAEALEAPPATDAPAPAPAPAWRTPTIAADPAQEVVRVDSEDADGDPEAQVFDFDEDDLDADPANRPRTAAEAEAAKEAQERSRFAFRYRYEDDE